MSITKSTIVVYEYSGSTNELTIPFDYLKRDFVVVALGGDGKPQKALKLGADYRFATKTTIVITRQYQPDEGYNKVIIRRVTDASKRIINYQDGSILNASELNTSQLQALHVAEEARDLANYTLFVDDNNNLDARGRKIINLGDPTNPQDAVTKKYVDTASESVIDSRDKTLQYRNEAERFRNEAESFKDKTSKDSSTVLSKIESADALNTQAVTNSAKATQSALDAQKSASSASLAEKNAKASDKNASLSADNAKMYADSINPKNFTRRFKNVSELATETFKIGDVIFLEGFWSSGDGGAHYRICSEEENSASLKDSKGNNLNLYNIITLNPRQTGAKGDGRTDDTLSFIKVFSISEGYKVEVTKGTYVISDTIRLPAKFNVEFLKGSTIISKIAGTSIMNQKAAFQSEGVAIVSGVTTTEGTDRGSFKETFNTTDTSELNVGDIVGLEDTTNAQQFYAVITSKTSNSITLDRGCACSVKEGSTILKMTTVSTGSFKGLNLEIDNSNGNNYTTGIHVRNFKDVIIEDIKTRNICGKLVLMLRGIDGIVNNVNVVKAIDTNAGCGYAVRIGLCNNCKVSKVNSTECRHTVDISTGSSNIVENCVGISDLSASFLTHANNCCSNIFDNCTVYSNKLCAFSLQNGDYNNIVQNSNVFNSRVNRQEATVMDCNNVFSKLFVHGNSSVEQSSYYYDCTFNCTGRLIPQVSTSGKLTFNFVNCNFKLSSNSPFEFGGNSEIILSNCILILSKPYRTFTCNSAFAHVKLYKCLVRILTNPTLNYNDTLFNGLIKAEVIDSIIDSATPYQQLIFSNYTNESSSIKLRKSTFNATTVGRISGTPRKIVIDSDLESLQGTTVVRGNDATLNSVKPKMLPQRIASGVGALKYLLEINNLEGVNAGYQPVYAAPGLLDVLSTPLMVYKLDKEGLIDEYEKYYKECKEYDIQVNGLMDKKECEDKQNRRQFMSLVIKEVEIKDRPKSPKCLVDFAEREGLTYDAN